MGVGWTPGQSLPGVGGSPRVLRPWWCHTVPSVLAAPQAAGTGGGVVGRPWSYAVTGWAWAYRPVGCVPGFLSPVRRGPWGPWCCSPPPPSQTPPVPGQERAHERLPRPQGCTSRRCLLRACEVGTLQHQPRGSVQQSTCRFWGPRDRREPPVLARLPCLWGCGQALWLWKWDCHVGWGVPSLSLSVLSAPWLRGLARLPVTSLHRSPPP